MIVLLSYCVVCYLTYVASMLVANTYDEGDE